MCCPNFPWRANAGDSTFTFGDCHDVVITHCNEPDVMTAVIVRYMPSIGLDEEGYRDGGVFLTRQCGSGRNLFPT